MKKTIIFNYKKSSKSIKLDHLYYFNYILQIKITLQILLKKHIQDQKQGMLKKHSLIWIKMINCSQENLDKFWEEEIIFCL